MCRGKMSLEGTACKLKMYKETSNVTKSYSLSANKGDKMKHKQYLPKRRKRQQRTDGT